MALPIHSNLHEVKILPPVAPPPPPAPPLELFPFAPSYKLHFNELIAHLPRRLKEFAKEQIRLWEENLQVTFYPQERTARTKELLGKLVFVADRSLDDLVEPITTAKITAAFDKESGLLFSKMLEVDALCDSDPFHSFDELYPIQLAQVLGCALITSQGILNVGVIEELRILDGNRIFKRLLDLLSPDFQEDFHRIQAPFKQDSNAATLIRAQLQLEPITTVTDIHAKQVALGALLAETSAHWTKELIHSRLDEYQSLLQFGHLVDLGPFPLFIEDASLDQEVTISPQGRIGGMPYHTITSLGNAMRMVDAVFVLENPQWILSSAKELIKARVQEENQNLAFYGFANHRHRLVEALHYYL